MSDHRSDDEIARDEELQREEEARRREEEAGQLPVEEPPITPVVEPPVEQPPREGRVTHDAMTWQEELVWAEKLEAEDRDLTDEEVAHIEQIKQTAADHEAIEKAQAEAAKEK